MGQTTAFRKETVKTSAVILGENQQLGEVRYLHGDYGKGTWTFLGGHDPEDYSHFVGDPPTDLNLYPNYASVAKNTDEQTVNQLGTATYTEHIAQYCKNVPTDYICYDFYVYSARVPLMYDNLKVISDACTGTARSMWIVL